MTPDQEAHLSETLFRTGRYPQIKALCKAWGLTKQEVTAIVNEHRHNHGKRPYSPRKERKERKERNLMDWALDGGALTLAVIIDLILNAVVFVVVAPDPLTKAGMFCLSFVVVLFSVRGWIKGGVAGKTLWAVFAIVATFSDISFALSATDLQAQKDPEFTRLTDKVDHDQGQLDELLMAYNLVGKGFRSELAERQKGIDEAKNTLAESTKARDAYRSKGQQKELTSEQVFTAIPSAVASSRWIQLVFFTMIFLGLQLTIVTAAGVDGRKIVK